MSLKPTSHCGRIVGRHVSAPCGTIWITDSILKSAFDRYCAMARVTVRHGSSVPGPMENRRRLGKRHMGELNFGQSHASAPFWELADAVDLTQWKWQPPTSSHDLRHQDSQAPDPQRLTLRETISNWLSRSSPDLAEDSKDIQDAASTVPEQLPPDVAISQEGQAITWGARASPRDVMSQGINLLYLDISLSSTLSTAPNFGRFCSALRQSLSNGWFSDEQIYFISRHVRSELTHLMNALCDDQNRRHVDNLKLQLFEAIIDGLAVRPSNGHPSFETNTWNDLLHGISKLQRNNLRIFSKAMTHIPKSKLNSVSSGILANLNVFFTAMGRETRSGTPSRPVNKLANALRKLGERTHAGMLAAATQQVFHYRKSRDLNYERTRSGWLLVLARIPGISQEYLARTCVTLEAGRSTEPLTRTEIGRLYLAQFDKKDGSQLGAGNFIYRSLDIPDPNSRAFLPELCAKFWETNQPRHLRDLCQFLNDMGRSQDLLEAVRGFRNLIKNYARPLSNLAIGMGDPQLANEISALYVISLRRQRRGFWKSEFGARAIRRLLITHSLRPRKLLSALGLFSKQRGRLDLSFKEWRPAISVKQIWKVAQLAKALAIAPYLSNRESFRLIELCIHYLRYHNAHLPPLLIQALTHNVTRDLAQGKPGKTTRLIWTLLQMAKFGGPEAAQKFKEVIAKWRQQNFGPRP